MMLLQLHKVTQDIIYLLHKLAVSIDYICF